MDLDKRSDGPTYILVRIFLRLKKNIIYCACHASFFQLERLIASRAFALPVTRVEAAAAGDYYGSVPGSGSFNGSSSKEALLPRRGRSGDSIGYTRSGEPLKSGRGSRVPGISSQVGSRSCADGRGCLCLYLPQSDGAVLQRARFLVGRWRCTICHFFAFA